MAKTATQEAPEVKAEDKPKRKSMTPAERVAKLEAELAAAKAKAEARSNKARDEAHAKRAALAARVEKLQQQIDAIDTQFPPVSTESAEA